jgi:hypothetical protein
VERGEGPQQQWTNEQQKQLEAGLSTYPASLGLSQQERWRGIAEMVDVSPVHPLLSTSACTSDFSVE